MPVGSSIFIAARTINPALGRLVTSRWRQRYGPVPRSADVGAIGVCSCCSDAMAGRTITNASTGSTLSNAFRCATVAVAARPIDRMECHEGRSDRTALDCAADSSKDTDQRDLAEEVRCPVQPVGSHISLGSALTGDAWKELNSRLVDLLATVSPFEVCLDHVERSATNENTIFLGLRDGRPVVSIHRLLESSFPTLMEKDPDFVPHLSIGWFSEPRARDLAVEAVREHLEEVRFVAGVVSLYRRDQNGFWHPEQDVPLGVEGGGSGCSDL